jgi:transposase
MEFINGEDREQSILFPDSLDSYIDKESAVRIIDAFIDSLDLFELGFARYEPNDTGRPAYDPRCMLKLYLYGYMNRIRSSRRLENESKRNLEVMCLLEKLMPDHKTIANFRKDNKKSLKNVFKSFVKLCMGLDLYGKGKNAELVRKCETLAGYSVFVDKVREYKKAGMTLEEAIKKAVEYCLEHDILREFLEKNATGVMDMIYTEWDMDTALEVRFEEGREEGIERGREVRSVEVARNALMNGFSIDQIQIITGLDADAINNLRASAN